MKCPSLLPDGCCGCLERVCEDWISWVNFYDGSVAERQWDIYLIYCYDI